MSNAVVGERKDKLKSVNLSDIIVGERFRTDFGNMDDFCYFHSRKGNHPAANA